MNSAANSASGPSHFRFTVIAPRLIRSCSWLCPKTTSSSNRQLPTSLIPGAIGGRVRIEKCGDKGINVAIPVQETRQARKDLAWAIAVGGVGIVSFAALLLFTFEYAATLFLI